MKAAMCLKKKPHYSFHIPQNQLKKTFRIWYLTIAEKQLVYSRTPRPVFDCAAVLAASLLFKSARLPSGGTLQLLFFSTKNLEVWYGH